MSGRRYVVKKGDTLWDIARKHLGDPLQWPKLFQYNNLPNIMQSTGTKIVDPDLIYIGQTIVIPPKNLPSAQARPAPNITKAGQKKGAGKVKAREFKGPPIKYELADIPVSTVASPFHIMQIKLTGSITIQRNKASDLLSVSQERFIVAAKTEADTVLGKLISGNEVGWNPITKKVSFQNSITINANSRPIFNFALSTEISSVTGMPIIKASTTVASLKGSIDNHSYAITNLGIAIEITPLPQSAQPVPVPVKEPETSSGWDKVFAVGLVVTAGLLIVGTLVEDAFTAGAGVADDPASFAGAAAMMYKAKKLWNRLPGKKPIRVESHGLQNLSPAF
ncbi:MAG TPA: LysM peptidoglycan-binding domain-containing protein [Gammaproteobacteria bacterium]|nr:LysM peptidoglycan-binding domain-containing protein [Gammaproteobacteria bacterium]